MLILFPCRISLMTRLVDFLVKKATLFERLVNKRFFEFAISFTRSSLERKVLLAFFCNAFSFSVSVKNVACNSLLPAALVPQN